MSQRIYEPSEILTKVIEAIRSGLNVEVTDEGTINFPDSYHQVEIDVSRKDNPGTYDDFFIFARSFRWMPKAKHLRVRIGKNVLDPDAKGFGFFGKRMISVSDEDLETAIKKFLPKVTEQIKYVTGIIENEARAETFKDKRKRGLSASVSQILQETGWKIEHDWSDTKWIENREKTSSVMVTASGDGSKVSLEGGFLSSLDPRTAAQIIKLVANAKGL